MTTAAALTLLLDGMSDEQIASALIEERGTDRGLNLFWEMAQKLPVVCTVSCDKQDILSRLDDYGDTDESHKMTCSDEQLATIMHLVAQGRWEREYENVLDAILAALDEAKFLVRVEVKP